MNKISLSLLLLTISCLLISIVSTESINATMLQQIRDNYTKEASDDDITNSNYLFEQSELRRYDLYLLDENLKNINDHPMKEEYVEGALVHNGKVVDKVGIRYKGSYGGFVGCVSELNENGTKTCTKLSMKVKFGYKDSNFTHFKGVKKLQFHSQNLDATKMHERFAYYLYGKNNVPASRAVHALLYINNVFSGVYSLTEQMDESWMKQNFPQDSSANLYKEVWPTSELFKLAKNESDGVRMAQEQFTKGLQTNDKNPNVTKFMKFSDELYKVDQNDNAAVKALLEKWMDIPLLMKQMVIDRHVSHDDGFMKFYCTSLNDTEGTCSNHNLLWYESSTQDKVQLLTWDHDNSLDNSKYIAPRNEFLFIRELWNETKHNCQPKLMVDSKLGYPLNIVKSAACDKFIHATTLFQDEYNKQFKAFREDWWDKKQILNLLSGWSKQIEDAVVLAHKTNPEDQPSLEVWQKSVTGLFNDIIYNIDNPNQTPEDFKPADTPTIPTIPSDMTQEVMDYIRNMDMFNKTANDDNVQNSDYLYDQSQLRRFDFMILNEDLKKINDNPTKEEYVEGIFIMDFKHIVDRVGIRYKGSVGAFFSTKGACIGDKGQKTCPKLSMKVKFKWANSTVANFFGVKKLQFHSQNLDLSKMHERLSYYLYGKFGLPAPRAVHAKLYINGQFSGVYSLTEQIDESFLKRQFSQDPNGNLYKEIWPINSKMEANQASDFEKKLQTNEDDKNVTKMVEFAKDLQNMSTPEVVKQTLNKWLNMTLIMKQMVVDRAIAHDDGFMKWYVSNGIASNHNFYWYESALANKMHLLTWDHDNSLENLNYKAPRNNYTFIRDLWNETSNNCEPYQVGSDPLLNPEVLSAACDKLIKGMTLFSDEYDQQFQEFRNKYWNTDFIYPLLTNWSNQIKNATQEAHKAYPDFEQTSDEFMKNVETLKKDIEYNHDHSNQEPTGNIFGSRIQFIYVALLFVLYLLL